MKRSTSRAIAGITRSPPADVPPPKLAGDVSRTSRTALLVPDNGACVPIAAVSIHKSNIDVELYQQVLNRASRICAVPVPVLLRRVHVLARDHQYHDEISVSTTRSTTSTPLRALISSPTRFPVFFPGYDAEPAFRETYGPEFSDKLYVTNAGREWIDFMNQVLSTRALASLICASTWA